METKVDLDHFQCPDLNRYFLQFSKFFNLILSRERTEQALSFSLEIYNITVLAD